MPIPRARALPLVLALLILQACSSVAVRDYAALEPRFRPEVFFDGPLIATGLIKNRGGRVTRRFTAQINAYWSDGVGTLEEDFLFDDGETDRRVWKLTRSGDGLYVARAGDVVGDGSARIAGNSMFLKYVLRVPYGNGSIDLTIDDRMYLVTPDRLINESVMRKFGFKVGEIILSIERQGSAS